MKKTLSILLALIFVLSACSPTNKTEEDKKLEIGILQFASHPSLDNVREGFIAGLEEAGYKEGEKIVINYKNSDASIDQGNMIAKKFVSDKLDMIMAIATPSAMAAYSQSMSTDIPLIYSAVSDPIGAGLAKEDGGVSGKVSGVSDKLPVKEQLEMIRAMLPEAKTIGILYTTSEANSISTIEDYKALAGDYGFELEIQGISSAADIALATDSILGKVDCMTNLTDNTVVNSLPTILSKAKEKNIPVFGSEIEQVKMGCLAAEGIDYYELGKQTAKMAVQVLEGKDASQIAYETVEKASLFINQKVADDLGIQVPQDLRDRAEEIFIEITN